MRAADDAAVPLHRASLRQLRAFALVARHANFARAAAELHLTAPAVSMQIRELEDVVGTPLFERSARRVALTTAGEYLLVYVRRVLGTLKEAEDALARLRGLQAGRIVIGMVSTAEYFLPRLLARFRGEHPGIEIRLHVGNREQLLDALGANEVDLAVMGRPPQALAARAEAFAAHPLSVIAAPAHPLARKARIAPAALGAEPFIVRERGSGTRAAMEQFFQEQRIAPPAIMEMASNETIKQSVIAGMGLALLSLHTVAQEVALGQLCVLDVRGLPLMRRWHIVSLQARTLAPATEAFRYFVLAEGEKLLAELFSQVAPVAPARSARPKAGSRGRVRTAGPAAPRRPPRNVG